MFNSLKTAVVCLLLSVLMPLGLLAQGNTCRGTVLDPQGEPVIGASVLIKGGGTFYGCCH